MVSQRSSTHGGPATVNGGGTLAIVIAVVVFMFAYSNSPDGFIPILDHANLAFHEAGHVFFGMLGTTAGLYGGTLGQLVFPVAVTIGFLRQGAFVPAAFGLLWLFQNFLNIARYVADARAQRLPLVGGGEHDWTAILLRWNALSADTFIAGLLSTVAWLGLLGTVLWICRLWYRHHKPERRKLGG